MMKLLAGDARQGVESSTGAAALVKLRLPRAKQLEQLMQRVTASRGQT